MGRPSIRGYAPSERGPAERIRSPEKILQVIIDHQPGLRFLPELGISSDETFAMNFRENNSD